MAGCQEGRPSWMDTDFYPVGENLVKDAQTQQTAPFLVDIGGGKGQDLQELCQRFSMIPGQLILQDLPSVVGEATNLDPRIQPMEHDFFTAQPIKGMMSHTKHGNETKAYEGARAYYMHRIMHDWPDAKCDEILKQLRPAMTKGYSKLLINEHVVPAKGAHWLTTSHDILMMSLFSARERTEQNWQSLLGSAGFEIARIWTYEPGAESLIEAEPV